MNFEHPSQRLKPKFLREIKSEALLVFCKQLLMLNTDGLVIKAIFSEERFHKEADHIRKSIRKLTEQLGTHVIDQQYLDYLILNHRKKICTIYLPGSFLLFTTAMYCFKP
jgi:hypothetical protein